MVESHLWLEITTMRAVHPFGALTRWWARWIFEECILILISLPLSLFPSFSHPLLSRLVHSGPGKGSPQAAMDLSFATRTGTKQGIETHLFRAEVSRDLSHWTRSIVQGCHNSAELITEITTGEYYCLWATNVPRRQKYRKDEPVAALASKYFLLLVFEHA